VLKSESFKVTDKPAPVGDKTASRDKPRTLPIKPAKLYRD